MKNFKSFAAMIDCSRDAVMNVESIKRFILLLEKMGFDSLLLYMEDTFEVPNEPYFGYLRGRYSQKEIRDLCAYGREHHVEVSPCVEMLAHLNAIFHHQAYSDIHDLDDILLIDEERTYELLDRLFSSLESSFLSRTLHIGLDEAHMVGLGKYKDKHGIVDRTDLFVRHLNKIREIAKKHGFHLLMWSDMFFRLATGGEYYDVNAELKPEKLKDVPDDVDQVYWDYYHDEQEIYSKMIELHRGISKADVVFAGGVWTWAGFAPLLSKAKKTIFPALASCREKGVDRVIMTAWGDDGAECSIFSALPAFFYAREAALGITDDQQIARDFEAMFSLPFEDFLDLELPNVITHTRDRALVTNPCKYFFYNDPLLGQFDVHADEKDEALYREYARRLLKMKEETGEFGYLFSYLSSLCSFLEVKVALGKKLRAAYQKKDRQALAKLSPRIEEATQRLASFMEESRSRWIKENKRQGLEISQIRLAGLKERLLETKRVVDEFLAGKISSIPELEETILPVEAGREDEKAPLCYNCYQWNATLGRL